MKITDILGQSLPVFKVGGSSVLSRLARGV